MTDLLPTPAEAQAWSAIHRRNGHRVALVPTMGALHAGHLHLVTVAREYADVVAMSIFVNPLQFNRSDDFTKYPRPIDDDLRLCNEAGVDAVYAPTAATMYPQRFQTHVEPGALAEPLEGAGRPGHFRGVTTVVTKLFNAVQPDVALFGQKDFQQLAIIRQMATDLDTGIVIVGVPTVREPDGVAMSSRNRRLSGEHRAAAVCLSRGLFAAASACAGGQTSAATLTAITEAEITNVPGASIEYIRVNDATTLLPVDVVAEPCVISLAVWFGDVRLIDNVVVGQRS